MSEPEVPMEDIESRLGEKVMAGLQPQEQPEPEEQPAEPAAAPQEQAPPTEQPYEIPEHLRGLSNEQIARMHASLELKLGEQGDELGAARQQLRQYEQQYEEPAAMPEYQLNTGDLDAFDQIIEEDPARAAAVARDLKNDYLYDRAVSAWAEEDPYAAMRFNTDVQMQQYVAQVEERLAPVMRTAQNQEWFDTWREVKAKEAPDLDNYASAMNQVMHQNPALVRAIGQATGEERAQLVRVLYHSARSMTGTHGAPAPPAGSLPEAAPPPPHVTSGETGRVEPAQGEPLDVVQYAIRQYLAGEPTIEAGLTRE